MWESGRDGFGGQGETSRINTDKAESILTSVEVFQPISAFPSHLADGEHAVLSMQHLAAARTRGNTLKKKGDMQMLLSGHQTASKKSCLPAYRGTSSKQLAQKVRLNISSLTLMAFAIYGVKQSFPSP